MEYLPVLIMMGIGLLIGLGAMGISTIIGPRIKNRMKDQPFECGVPPVGEAKQRVSVRFYLVAISFLLFDVEALFFYPFAVVFREFMALGPAIFWIMGLFTFLVLLGFYYELRRGALEWD